MRLHKFEMVQQILLLLVLLAIQVIYAAAADEVEGSEFDEVAPEECSYTFRVTGAQLGRYCASTPNHVNGNGASMIRIRQQLDSVIRDNSQLKNELEELKRSCKGTKLAIEELKKETSSWRQVIHWPQLKDSVSAGDHSLILENGKSYPDCWKAYKSGQTKRGIYTLKPKGAMDPFMAFCDDGWTIIQRRFDGTVSFDRKWEEYGVGFGDMSGEFWLGNDKVHLLTAQEDYVIAFEGVTYGHKLYRATHVHFQVGDEVSDYQVRVGNMTAGNYADVLSIINGRKFSAKDRDNDEWWRGNCARHYRAGWWMNNCGWSPNHEYCDGRTCMQWGDKRLKKSLLKIRPAVAGF